MATERAHKLLDLVYKAKTKEDIKAVWDSGVFKQASGIEVALANMVLGFAYIRLELDDIRKDTERRLGEIERKLDEIKRTEGGNNGNKSGEDK